MTKNNRDFLLGVLFGFIGMAFWALALNGFEYVVLDDILDLAKQLVAPYVVTTIFVAFGVEGFKALKAEFKEFVNGIRTKISKKAEA